MNATESQQLLLQKINNDDRHEDYLRVVEVEGNCRMYVTNVGLEQKLRQYKVRESDEAFTQRKRLTRFIIKSIIASLRKPYYKVSRNDKVISKIDIKEEAKAKAVADMQAGFFGRKNKNGGLNSFLRTRFVELSFIDPNAWVVVEWPSFAEGALPQPYPYEVKASEALDFQYLQGKLQWLFVRTFVNMKTAGEEPAGPKIVTKNGSRYSLYADNTTVVMTEYDPDYYTNNNIPLPEGKNIDFVVVNNVNFIRETFVHNAGMVPAFRVGYQRDDLTDGRTFVAPYDAAEPYLEKAIDSTSELDLSIAGHVFPQKFQYASPCPGPSVEERCTFGKLATGEECPSCKGEGFKFHKTAQDAIILPLPSSSSAPTNEDIIDLSKLVYYAAVPIDTVKFQKDYVDFLEIKCHTAMYNSTVFVADTNRIAKTATEKDMDMDSVYDTLAPFADKYSELWVDFTTVMVRLAGLDPAQVGISHSFPGDFKLRTQSQLLNQLKVLNESEAPSFVKDSVNRDLAEVMSGGDKMEMLKYDVKRRFFPFNGKGQDEIFILLSLPYTPTFDKVLYANFEKIFAEIEKDDRIFFTRKFAAQWEIVGKKVNEIMADITAGTADRFQVGDIVRDTPSNSGGNEEGTTPGGNTGNNPDPNAPNDNA